MVNFYKNFAEDCLKKLHIFHYIWHYILDLISHRTRIKIGYYRLRKNY